MSTLVRDIFGGFYDRASKNCSITAVASGDEISEVIRMKEYGLDRVINKLLQPVKTVYSIRFAVVQPGVSLDAATETFYFQIEDLPATVSVEDGEIVIKAAPVDSVEPFFTCMEVCTDMKGHAGGEIAVGVEKIKDRPVVREFIDRNKDIGFDYHLTHVLDTRCDETHLSKDVANDLFRKLFAMYFESPQ